MDTENLAADVALLRRKEELLSLLIEERGLNASQSDRIAPREWTVDPPLSFAQQRLWFLEELLPGTPVYNIARAVRLEGCLHVEALQQALDAIVARHEALRTTFLSVHVTPRQVIAESGSVELPVIDLTNWLDAARVEHPPRSKDGSCGGTLPDSVEHPPRSKSGSCGGTLPDLEAEVQRLLQEEAWRPFNLSRDLMVRATLLRLAAEEHVLLLVMHHIASDIWSLGVLFRELSRLYAAFTVDQRPVDRSAPGPLPALPIQYADFALWQRQFLRDGALQAQLSYWKRQLANAPAVLALATDRPRPAIQSCQGARQTFRLSAALTQALHTLSQRSGMTLFMTLLAAFQTLLHRYSGQADLMVGTPIANRNRVETEGLIGFFLNTLVLRTDLSGDPMFSELLGRVREVCLEAYAHQQLPFERLVEEECTTTSSSWGATPCWPPRFSHACTRRFRWNCPCAASSRRPRWRAWRKRSLSIWRIGPRRMC